MLLTIYTFYLQKSEQQMKICKKKRILFRELAKKRISHAQNHSFLARCLQGTGALAAHSEMGTTYQTCSVTLE